MTTLAAPVRRATVKAEKGKATAEVRFYPSHDRLEYRPDSGVPIPVLLWVKEMLRDSVPSAFCRWDGARWAYEAA